MTPYSYDRRCASADLYKSVLGDPRYGEGHRYPKWNIRPTVLDEPRLFPQVFPELTRSDHARLAGNFERRAKEMQVDHYKAIERNEQKYGDTGPLISGGLRDHWPEDAKDEVRYLAHGYTLLSKAADAHKAATRLRRIP